ncbi:hypothetical protein GCM10027436_54890 [Actinophytocola sediminis]
MGGDFLANGVTQTVPEMPSVGDLDRVRQCVPHRLRIRGRAVPAHILDPSMGPQPAGHHLSAAPRQHVDPGAGVGINQHGRVVMTSAQGEIVDPQRPRHLTTRQRASQQDPHSGVPPDRDPHGRCPARQLAHDTANLLAQPDGPPLVPLNQARYLLPEGLARALVDSATHPTDSQPHQHPASINRHIRRHPLAEGMNPVCRRPTDRTRHPSTPGRCPHHDHITSVLDTLDRQGR